jgi:universal stress protein E
VIDEAASVSTLDESDAPGDTRARVGSLDDREQMMARFKHILVAASPGILEVPVLKKAARLAEAHGARLTVLDVVEPIPARRRIVHADGRSFDIEAMVIDDQRRRLGETIDSADAAGAVAEVVAGKPFVEVTRFAMANDCDLVIVGESLPVEDRMRVVASDVAQLVRACPTPVWVMCPSTARKLRVLALVDPEPLDEVRDSLNDSILDLATSVTRWGDGELHVAHAWQVVGESTMRSSLHWDLSEDEVDAMIQEVREEAEAKLERLAARHGVPRLGGQTHLIKGAPAEVLPELADRLDINLIVMGTVARRGLIGLIMGNTAETIMRAVRCSILTVKPDGFVSPVSTDS